eukprot:scaffold1062_cov130-Cylindrotheca_fusiformis.AAC.45
MVISLFYHFLSWRSRPQPIRIHLKRLQQSASMSSSDPRRKRNPNAGTLVVRDPNKGGRSNQRRPPPNGQRRQRGAPPPQRRGDPQWQDPDDVSEVSEAEYEQDYEEQTDFFVPSFLLNDLCQPDSSTQRPNCEMLAA